MAVEDRNCFIGKTIDNQLYTILQKMVEKGYAEDIPSRECFNELTLDSQLYLVYAALKRELWTPTQIPTIFWYDAADLSTITAIGNQVTQMLDKSGNGWTLAPLTAGKIGPDTGTRTLNGLNVLEFSSTFPSNQILENNTFAYNQATTPINIAMILRCDDEAVLDSDFLFSGTEVSSPRIFMRRKGNNQLELYNTSGIATPLNSAPENQDLLVIGKVNATNSAIRLNGTLLASGNIGTDPFTSLNIGGNFIEDQGIEGYIAEVISFADNTKQEIVEGYLAWKWGLEAKLPIGHPYKNFPPKV